MGEALKSNKTKELTIEQAAGDGSMMVFSKVRSEQDVKFMSEWAEKRNAAISSLLPSSASTK